MLQVSKRASATGYLLSFLFLVACSTTPQVQQFSDSTDPAVEINNLESNLNKAGADQVNALSPDFFKKAEKQLKEAKEARSDNKSNQKVLKEVALGNAWLLKATETAKRGADVIPDIVDVRARAIESKAYIHAKDSWSKAEKDLKDIGEDFEDGDFSVKNKDREKLLARYMDAELIAIRQSNLGPAQANIHQAEQEGAKKVAPQTLALAKKKLVDAQNYIVSNRQNTTGITEVSKKARNEAERVLRITREAKLTDTKTPEQLALGMEAEEKAKKELSENLSESQSELQNKDSRIAAMAAETSDLSDKVALDEKYKEAREMFKEDEAEVFKDVDKVVIRLKGLKFPSGQADLTSASYPLMTKLQNVIKNFEDSEVDIEGHTDSIGKKEYNAQLSELRADAVKNYLIENGAVDMSHVTAAGYGDEKPVTTNNTPNGRAQNRRVDVIISPTR